MAMRTPADELHSSPSWFRFGVKALAFLVAFFGIGGYLTDRFHFGINIQGALCLPNTRVVLIDRYDRIPRRGDPVAFRVRGTEPWFPTGTLFVKMADGVPGDTVEVGESTLINGVPVVSGLALASALDRLPNYFERTEVLGPDQYLMLGRTENSFDGRYWGTVSASQIVGRAYLLF